MDNTIIIKIESGAVAEIYASEPAQVIVVDHDLIEGGETFEERMQKSVMPMFPEYGLKSEDVDEFVKTLVLECRRPKDEVDFDATTGAPEDAMHALSLKM